MLFLLTQETWSAFPVLLHCPKKYADKYTLQALSVMKRGTRKIFHALTLDDLQSFVVDANKGKKKDVAQHVLDACAQAANSGSPPSIEALARVVKALMVADREKTLEQRAAQRAKAAEQEQVGF